MKFCMQGVLSIQLDSILENLRKKEYQAKFFSLNYLLRRDMSPAVGHCGLLVMQNLIIGYEQKYRFLPSLAMVAISSSICNLN